MRNFIVGIVAASLMMLAGCNGCNPGCTVESTIVGAVVPAVVSGLQCKNEAAVKADIEAMIGKIGICKQSDKPQLPGPICDVVASMIVGTVGSTIPATWQCSAANAKDLLKGLISQACQKI